MCAVFIVWISKARQLGVRQLTRMHVHASELRATRERRHRLAGIQQAVWIERPLDREETLERLGRELRAHAADLLDAHAVLAGDRAADIDAKLEDAIAELDGAFTIAGLVRVEQDQRMQIAVSGVEHVRAWQPVFARPRLDLAQHARQRGAWNGPIDAIVIGRDAPYGGERRLSSR